MKKIMQELKQITIFKKKILQTWYSRNPYPFLNKKKEVNNYSINLDKIKDKDSIAYGWIQLF